MLHSHFTRDDRIALSHLLWAGKTQALATERLGKSPGAVSREIQRNKDSDGVYRGGSAQRKTRVRRFQAKAPSQKLLHDKKLRRHVVRKLKKYWSPEQIAGRLKRFRGRTIISHETIYQFIYEDRPDLKTYLRCQKGKYRRKRGTAAREKARDAAKTRYITERPAIVEERSRIGDWEGDTIIDTTKRQRILTHVERKSGFGIADKLNKVTVALVEAKTQERFKELPKTKRHTITWDNGTEFGEDDTRLEKCARIKIYRATPYHSWERGTNENWNGLLRQFFPKKTSFANITQDDVEKAVRLLNNRPRKRLGYLTPREVFNGRCISS